MIDTPTALILGAGASSPYNFPTGYQLYEAVCNGRWNRPEGPEVDIRLATEMSGFTDYDAMREVLRSSGYESVDTFLGKRTEYMAVGKAAIAATLIPFEDPRRCQYRRARDKTGITTWPLDST